MFPENIVAYYFSTLLNIDSQIMTPIFDGGKIIVPVAWCPRLYTNAAPQIILNNTPYYVIDYIPRRDIGPIVPQILYSPESSSAARIAQLRENLQLPVFFRRKQSAGGGIGISLVDAASRRVESIEGESLPVQARLPSSTTFILHWLGYPEYEKQFWLTPGSGAPPITTRQLIEKVGRFVNDFLQQPGEPARSVPQSVRDWRIGANVHEYRRRIIIIGIIQVSTGRWQPIIQLLYPHNLQ